MEERRSARHCESACLQHDKPRQTYECRAGTPRGNVAHRHCQITVIAEDFLARLERVKKSGDRQWSARCPAHADKGPSLTVKDSDGSLLIHCFAGCSAAEIVSAIGLNLSDLFPPRDDRERAIYRRERFIKGTLKDLEHELTIAMIVLGDVISGKAITPTDIERAMKARATIITLLREIPYSAPMHGGNRLPKRFQSVA